MNTIFKYIGMRNIKTALAVTFSVAVSELLHLEYPFFTAIAAVLAMQGSFIRGYEVGRDRLLGTIIGAVIGLIGALIAPGNLAMIFIGIVIVIFLLNVLKWQNSSYVGCLMFCAIMLNLNGDNPYIYAFYRTLDTFIGIVIASLVNYFICPPKYIKLINKQCVELIDEANNIVSENLYDGEVELISIENKIKTLEKYLELYLSEHELLKKEKKNVKHIESVLEHSRNILYNIKILMSLSRDNSTDEISTEYKESYISENIDVNLNEVVYKHHISNIIKNRNNLTSLKVEFE
ncbi:MAG: FUSC family protein [Clostridium argentinense]|uniref:FUSC family protein n=1 Tax=Clostridium faecium TaxID=2762223 RepID=A0ABR8YQ82_9CLOT|nr:MULTISPECIES: aromatic acid exporter family protein [Clostridium]MBD8046409.1 FUSC family protein [Clostridium faecium]MBS5823126.1 FUSC family protein [Clostridium argentinense]MDU1350379.1 aromatic acid exporter family protein [Clostridium argentinense]